MTDPLCGEDRKEESVLRAIDIIGVQMDLGASKRGDSMGPMAIR